MKVLITVGGTGGHVFPAEALAKEILKASATEILFVGGGLEKNRYFNRRDFPYKQVACGSISPRSPIRSGVNLWRLTKGFFQSLSIIKSFAPDLIVGFGSYHTFPILLAAVVLRRKFVLHEANSIPGKVNHLFSSKAIVTGIHFPEAANHLSGKTEEVGMPLREEYYLKNFSKQQAKAFYNLDPEKVTILIFGGSQGASAINAIAAETLALLRKRFSSFQILHFTGSDASSRQLQNQYHHAGISAVVRSFENQMHMAWLAGDLVISRSGASTIAEQIAMEVPGVLIPYPYAADQHQDKNADFMVRDVKGAIKTQEKDLLAVHLSEILFSILKDNVKKLKEMVHSIQLYKQKSSQKNLCKLVLEIVENRKK